MLSVAYSSDGTIIISGSRDKAIRIWDAQSGILENTLEGHMGGVISVAFSVIRVGCILLLILRMEQKLSLLVHMIKP